MGVGRGDRGPWSPLEFESFSAKRLCSWFPVGKNKIHHFWPPLEKFWKHPLVAPLEKILPTPMYIVI